MPRARARGERGGGGEGGGRWPPRVYSILKAYDRWTNADHGTRLDPDVLRRKKRRGPPEAARERVPHLEHDFLTAMQAKILALGHLQNSIDKNLDERLGPREIDGRMRRQNSQIRPLPGLLHSPFSSAVLSDFLIARQPPSGSLPWQALLLSDRSRGI